MTLPDHVIDYLETHPGADRLVVDAVYKRMAETMTTREMLDAAGFRSTEKTRAWARRVLKPLTEEQKAEGRRRLDLLEREEWPGDPA